MAYRPATKKQRVYFHALTGDWPPNRASSQEVSRLIDKAKRGEIEKRIPVLRVAGQSIWSPGWADHLKVKFVADLDYRPCLGPFATFEEARQAAEAYVMARPEGAVVLELAPDAVRQIYVD